jgi:tetratricopeptide (TPR) repeat protein
LGLFPGTGNLRQIEELLDSGTGINASDKGLTALMAASAFNHADIVKYLVDHGANVNSKDCDGVTALMYAAMHRNLDVLKILIDHGAELNAKDNFGNSVLYHALCKTIENTNDFEVMHLLIQNGAETENIALPDIVVDHAAIADYEITKIKRDVRENALKRPTPSDYSETLHNLLDKADQAEKLFGPRHPYVATTINNIAEIYRLQGRYQESEALFNRALSVYKEYFGEDHPHVATCLNNLALIDYSQKRYVSAERRFKRALIIYIKALGENHSYVGGVDNNLGELFLAQEKYAEAENYFSNAIKVWENALGPEHYSVGIAVYNLAELYRCQGQYSKAEPLFKRATMIRNSK